MAAQQVAVDQLDKDQIKSFQDFLLSYNKLSETCFSDCVFDFTTRTIKDTEVKKSFDNNLLITISNFLSQ